MILHTPATAQLTPPLSPSSSNKKRTPKWAKKLGVVDNTEELRRAKKSQWAKRYDERNPNSTHDNADLAEGEEGANYVPDRTIDPEEVERRRREGLWGREEEEYYNAGEWGLALGNGFRLGQAEVCAEGMQVMERSFCHCHTKVPVEWSFASKDKQYHHGGMTR